MAHLVVDGAPRPGTVLTLSHWPRTPTPPELAADLSTGIVMKFIAEGLRPPAARQGPGWATVDHYDEDGAVALALLVDEGMVDRHGSLALEVATTGDFDVVGDDLAAKVAFALRSISRRGQTVARSTQEALSIMDDLMSHPGLYESLWAEELIAYEASREFVASGALALEENAEADLAVFRFDAGDLDVYRTSWEGMRLHPAALNSVTSCMRVAIVMDAGRSAGGHAACAPGDHGPGEPGGRGPGAPGGRFGHGARYRYGARYGYEVRYRYETWVRLASWRPRARVDLTGLAERLSDMESSGTRWAFDGAGALRSALRPLGGELSSISPDDFMPALLQELAVLDAGPPAWDPYAPGTPLVPQAMGRSQMGNQRSRSGSMARSPARKLFSRNSSSTSRFSLPDGANG